MVAGSLAARGTVQNRPGIFGTVLQNMVHRCYARNEVMKKVSATSNSYCELIENNHKGDRWRAVVSSGSVKRGEFLD
jgi:hypothetical protein